jgi:hypothetical protein
MDALYEWPLGSIKDFVQLRSASNIVSKHLKSKTFPVKKGRNNNC